MDNYSEKRILVLGYGREGRSTLPFLRKKYPSTHISVADAAECEQTDLAQEWLCGSDYPKDISKWDIVVASPGIPPSDPVLKTARRVTSATNLFFEHCRGKIIAVTGSKGKSTTASLIAQILSAELVGNIGRPGLAALEKTNTENDVFVYEMSSYQARLVPWGPEIVVITNLFPEHLDYHGDVETYYRDKLNVTMSQSSHGHLFFNAQNEELAARAASSCAQKHPWPDAAGVHVDSDWIVLGGGERVMHLEDVPLLGVHNLSNVLGAISVGDHLGVRADVIAQKVKNFSPLPHRLQHVGTSRGITFYDDSISTTPESTIAALEALDRVDTIFLGGTDRGYAFTELAQTLKQRGVTNVVLFPDSGDRIGDAFAAIDYSPRILNTRDMNEAVAFAYDHTANGEICLLSCAAPSYSLYKNFEERGKAFQDAVVDLT